MQYVTSAICFSILMMVLITPFVIPLLLKRKGYVANLLLGSFLSLIMCVLLVSGLAYLLDLETSWRLGSLGFDFDAWTDEDRFRNIAPAFRDEAAKLYRSHMGIGWTLKAIIGAILLIPYHIVASGFVYMVSKRRRI
jgi:hypothetical protein